MCDNCSYGDIVLWHESVRNVGLQYTDKDIIWQCSKCNNANYHKCHADVVCKNAQMSENNEDFDNNTEVLIRMMCPAN